MNYEVDFLTFNYLTADYNHSPTEQKFTKPQGNQPPLVSLQKQQAWLKPPRTSIE